MFAKPVSPSSTAYRPLLTARVTAAVGAEPAVLLPSLLQYVTLPVAFTRANLNWPLPLKLTPSTAMRPW